MERRNCQEVISKMLKLIPEEKTEFIKDLKWNFEDAVCKAPEEILQWARTMQTLQEHIPNPSQDWEWEVLSIFTTKKVEELKSIFATKS